MVMLAGLYGCPPAPGPSGRRPSPGEIPPPPREREYEEDRQSAGWAYRQGLLQLDMSNYEAAIQFFHMAVERDPEFLQAYLSLGDAYRMQERFLVAETYYNKVLELDPSSIPALTALATMQWKMGNHRESLSLYRNVLEIDPENQFAQHQIELVTDDLFTLYYEQGMAYKEAGDLRAAAAEFQKAYSLYPKNQEFAVEIGNLFLDQQDYIMADRYFQQALSAEPDFVPALVGAGQAQLALQHYDEAIQYFEHALQVQPGDATIMELLRQTQQQKVEATLPQQYWEIVSAEQVSRGDIAALLMVDLMLETRLPPPSRVEIISDITTHWAKPYIINVVQYGIMRLPPDRFFRPDEPIQKGELAYILDAVLRKLSVPLSDESVVVFSDVHPDNIYHDAISRMYSAGLMLASGEDTFGMLDTLSGEEAIQIFEKVKLML
jgi:tetratricopeptide (TPR) repeat protein